MPAFCYGDTQMLPFALSLMPSVALFAVACGSRGHPDGLELRPEVQDLVDGQVPLAREVRLVEAEEVPNPEKRSKQYFDAKKCMRQWLCPS